MYEKIHYLYIKYHMYFFRSVLHTGLSHAEKCKNEIINKCYTIRFKINDNSN